MKTRYGYVKVKSVVFGSLRNRCPTRVHKMPNSGDRRWGLRRGIGKSVVFKGSAPFPMQVLQGQLQIQRTKDEILCL